MNITERFHLPLLGDTATYFCLNCKKSFAATVPELRFFDIFRRTMINRARCPNCNKLCTLDPKTQY